MNLDSQWTLTKILEKYEIGKIPPEILEKVETYCESRYKEFTKLNVLYETSQENIDELRKYCKTLSSILQDAKVKIDAEQTNVTKLSHQLEHANSEIKRLYNQVEQHKSEGDDYRKKSNDSSVLAEMATKEESLDKKQFLNNEMAKLTEKLNKNMTELLALRQNNTLDFDQLEIDLKQKTEDLCIANKTISQLTETNRLLKNKSEENTVELKVKFNESIKLVDHYRKEWEVKNTLADFYKKFSDECQAQANELTTVIKELRQMLDETTNQCGIFEAKLKDNLTQHQIDLNVKDGMIVDLKAELKCYEVKASNLENQLNDAEHSQRDTEGLLVMCSKQKERFKELYYDAIKKWAESLRQLEGDIVDGEYQKASEIEKKLLDKIMELKDLKEEYDGYLEDSSANFKFFYDGFDVMQNEIKELISANSKVLTQIRNQQIEEQETNVSIHRNEIQTLIEHYPTTMIDEALNNLKKLTTIENQCQHLQSECRRLMETNSILEVEHTSTDQHNQTLSSNMVETTEAGVHKRSRNVDDDSFTGLQKSCPSEEASPQKKRTRLGVQDDDIVVDIDDENDHSMSDEAHDEALDETSNELKAFDNSASTEQISGDPIEVNAEDEFDIGSDGRASEEEKSSEQERIKVDEGQKPGTPNQLPTSIISDSVREGQMSNDHEKQQYSENG